MLEKRETIKKVVQVVLIVAIVTAAIYVLMTFEDVPVSPHYAPIVDGRSGKASTSSATEAHTHYKLDDDVSVGYWSYRCRSATWTSYLPIYRSLQSPDAAFLVVDLAVRNNDRTASVLPTLHLVDAQGREYDESSKGSLMQGSFDTLKTLNPGVSSRGYVVFDAPHGKYVLKLSGGLESVEYALVDLPGDPEQNLGTSPARPVVASPSPSPPVDVSRDEIYDSVPRALYKPNAEYTEEALNAKLQGVVVLSATVGTDGRAHDITVQRSLGMGLDENAINTFTRWTFAPAMKNGNPAPAHIDVDITFRLREK